MSLFPRIPVTLGHENAGVISEVGPGMEDHWTIGDRVGRSPTFADGDAIGDGAWVGTGRLGSTINTYPIIIKQLTIRGSESGTKQDLEELDALMKSGDLNPPLNLIAQADIPAFPRRVAVRRSPATTPGGPPIGGCPPPDRTIPDGSGARQADAMPPGTPPAVLVDGLRKQYGPTVAVDDVSFTIERGETFALLGPNGAGKSTTVEILEGYRVRTAGRVEVLGVDPQHAGRAEKAKIGIVLQSNGDSGNVTVQEQLRQFARFYPRPRDVDEVLRAVGLEQQARTRIGRLSGGQRRRVDVALGIIGNPEVLFLDEPTTGFDPEARRQFWDLIRDVQQSGTTVLLTTHYLDEAAQLADRAAVIADGRLLDIGPIDELGGADARTPRVRWLQDGTHHEERVNDPGVLVARLQAELGTIHNLEVIRPSLEDVYLTMVGHKEAEASA